MCYEEKNGLIFILRDLVGGSYVTRQIHLGDTTTTTDFTSKYSNDIILSSNVIRETDNYLYGFVSSGISAVYGFSSYALRNIIYINGEPYGLQHGDTFVRGVTTVTVNINTNCQPISD